MTTLTDLMQSANELAATVAAGRYDDFDHMVNQLRNDLAAFQTENPHVVDYAKGEWVEGCTPSPDAPGVYAIKDSRGSLRWAWFDGLSFGGSADHPEHAYAKRNYFRASPVVAWWRVGV